MADEIEVSEDGAEAKVIEADLAGLASLREVADLRRVWLNCIDLTPEALRLVAGLPQIAALIISGISLTADQFTLLEALPPGVAVRIEEQKHNCPEWNAFRRRRANQAARLSPERRQEAANRYARGIASICWYSYEDGRTVRIKHGNAADDDLRLLRWLPQLETLIFHRCWGVTSAGLRHLAGHPGLKTIDFNGPIFTGPLRPLARCPSLESFEFFPEDGMRPGDAHTVGLDRVAGLRRLKGWAGSFTEPTLARIGRLKELRFLSLPLGKLQGDDSLRPLAGLSNLEYLSLQMQVFGDEPTSFSDECLRHLAGLTRLRFLNLGIGIEIGNGDGLRHLSGLKNLEFLSLGGQAVTNAGLRHLQGLPNLKAVLPTGRVTPKGATELAAAQPGVVVHLEGRAFLHPPRVVRFRRQALGDFASALIPSRWDGHISWPVPGCDEPPITVWTESGFSIFVDEMLTHVSNATPAEIRMWVEAQPTESDAATYLRKWARDKYSGRLPKRFEAGVVPMASGGDSASGMFPQDRLSCLAGVVLRGGKSAAILGGAPPGRFAKYRGLFEFVAASLRVGPDALFGEVVDVPSDELV